MYEVVRLNADDGAFGRGLHRFLAQQFPAPSRYECPDAAMDALCGIMLTVNSKRPTKSFLTHCRLDRRGRGLRIVFLQFLASHQANGTNSVLRLGWCGSAAGRQLHHALFGQLTTG